MKIAIHLLACWICCIWFASMAWADTHYYCVDLTGIANFHFQDGYGGAENLPMGNVTLGGILFCIPEGNNAWTSNQGSGTIFVDIPVNRMGIREVHTLINTSWGQVGPYTMLEFFGDQGAYYAKSLYGNSDIRDWLNNTWTNTINNSSTVNVWSGTTLTTNPGSACRMDKQAISLPTDFAGQILTHVRLTDWGGSTFHRAFLSGMTVGEGSCIQCNLVKNTTIDFEDFAAFASFWMNGDCNQPQESCRSADFDENGSIGLSDLTILADCWLKTLPIWIDVQYYCVDLTGIANRHYQDGYSGAANLPTGNVRLGGTPFCIPDGNNGWTSNQGSGTIFVDIPVNLVSIREVHTLINTSWGQVGPYTKLEFFGDKGAYYAKNLSGNSDIRDWLNGSFCNTINMTALPGLKKTGVECR